MYYRSPQAGNKTPTDYVIKALSKGNFHVQQRDRIICFDTVDIPQSLFSDKPIQYIFSLCNR